MYPVSQDFLGALTHTHQTYASLTVTPPTGTPFTLPVQSGTVTATYQQGTRRTASLTAYATGTDTNGNTVNAQQSVDALKRDGTLLTVSAGIGSSLIARTLIPMITGICTDVSWRVGDGMIDMGVTDEWWRVAQGRFTVPWTPAAGLQRTLAVQQLMQQVAPNRQTVSTASDTGVIQSQGDWGVDRDSAVNTLCTDGVFDAYFDREGRIHLEDSKQSGASSVWSMIPGDQGVIQTLESGLDAQRLYNTVVVKPSGTDNSQSWTAQSASMQEGDRAPSTLGVTIPYFIASPTIGSAGDALRVAQQQLSRVTGTTQTLQCDAIANPALDEGDVIQVLVPASETEGVGATMWDYYVDTITWDLQSGGMTVRARNQGEVQDSAQ